MSVRSRDELAGSLRGVPILLESSNSCVCTTLDRASATLVLDEIVGKSGVTLSGSSLWPWDLTASS